MLCIADPGPEEEEMEFEDEIGDDEQEEKCLEEVKEAEEADPSTKPKID